MIGLRPLAFSLTVALTLSVSGSLGQAAVSAAHPNGSTDIMTWIFHYPQHPDPARVPTAYRVLSTGGLLRDPEQAGVYLGFLAGIMARSGTHADRLLAELSGIAPEDQWILVRALAFSGRSDWRALMSRLVPRVPARAKMAQAYLSGELPALDKIALETEKPSKWLQVKDWITFHKRKPEAHQQTFEDSPELLDTLWGLYFATGDTKPIRRILLLLPWSKDNESVAKLTIGNMARYTLANNASKSPQLLSLLEQLQTGQPKEIAPVLAEVVRAAEDADITYLRREALASIEELKRRGPDSFRKMAWWGQLGSGAISLGCLGAAVAGAGAAVGIPCVVGGAVSEAGLKMIATP